MPTGHRQAFQGRNLRFGVEALRRRLAEISQQHSPQRKEVHPQWFRKAIRSRLASFVAGILVPIACSYAANYIPVLWTIAPDIVITPPEAPIHLTIYTRNAPYPYDPPKLIRVTSSVGPFNFEAEMAYQQPAREDPSHSPLQAWEYVDRSPSVHYDHSVKRIDQLVGQQMSTYIPFRSFHFNETTWARFDLAIEMHGHRIVMNSEGRSVKDQNDYVETDIDKN